MMRIVHFSITPLACAPWLIVSALRRHTQHDVRLVELERWPGCGQDLVFREKVDEVVAVVEGADVLHLHNYLDLDSEDFAPIDFRALAKHGKAVVRHFHSHPAVVAAKRGVTVSDVLNSPTPSVVIAQFQERYYPRARVVPNIVPQDDPAYRPLDREAEPDIDVFFAPSTKAGAWADRWNTKGSPEVDDLLGVLAERTGCRVRIETGRALRDVLEWKQRSRIVIDDLVTGSYHLAGLEGLSMGRAVCAYLDDRTRFVLSEISGSGECPFLNVRLESAFEPLRALIHDPGGTRERGALGRRWMEEHWNDASLVRHFVEVYETLLDDPCRVSRQPALSLEGRGARILAVSIPNMVHGCRAAIVRRAWRSLLASWQGRARWWDRAIMRVGRALIAMADCVAGLAGRAWRTG